jgi:DNA-binding IclR family transcriptional regulator
MLITKKLLTHEASISHAHRQRSSEAADPFSLSALKPRKHVGLFKQDGDQRGAFEFRTGLIPMLTSAAGKIYAARLPTNLTTRLIEREWGEVFGGKSDVGKFREDASRELKRKGYTTIISSDLSGYVSIAAPVLDWNGDLRFTLSLAGTRASMKTEPTSEQVKSLLTSASRATQALGGKAESGD